MTDLLIDDFNRANNTSVVGAPSVGPTPTALLGTWGINGNQLYAPTVVSGDAELVWDLAVADVDITVQVPTYSTVVGIVFRAVDASNYYVLQINPGLTLQRRVAGTYTTVVNRPNTTYGSGTTLRLVVSGTQIVGYVNGVLMVATDDYTFTSGTKHGVRIGNAAARLDNITAVTVSSPILATGAGAVPVTQFAATSATNAGFVYKGRANATLDTGSAS